MATRLTKPVARVVTTRDGEELVLTLSQAGIFIRPKGRRTEYGPVSYGSLLVQAASTVAGTAPPRPRAAKRVSRNLLKL